MATMTVGKEPAAAGYTARLRTDSKPESVCWRQEHQDPPTKAWVWRVPVFSDPRPQDTWLSKYLHRIYHSGACSSPKESRPQL